MSEPSINDLGLVTLKHGASYALFDARGDIAPEPGMMGLYVDDMRYVSALTLLLGGQKPCALEMQVSDDTAELVTTLGNPALRDAKGGLIAENTLQVTRRSTVYDGRVHQAITLRNKNGHAVSLPLSFRFDSDFVDMFTVRGSNPNTALGTREEVRIDGGALWSYKGVDDVARKTALAFSVPPEKITADKAEFTLTLPPGGEATVYLDFGRLKSGAAPPGAESYGAALKAVRNERATVATQGAQLAFSNPQLQAWFGRSRNDLAFLMNHYDSGLYPCAGVPWFAVPFGRDGIITALETLWAQPDIAKGVLQFLSDKQARQAIAAQDAEPGKIMHETREDEMSRVGLVPFGLYYGGVDTTLLYVMLAGEYLKRTDDEAFIRQIWPNLQAALGWMEDYAEDKKGFMVYQRKLESGLYNQMWKDSGDSIFDEKGNTDVAFPRAVCEVQGYAYAAWNTGRKLAELFHEDVKAQKYAQKAATLYKNFNEAFWDEKDAYYVLALDGNKVPCRVRASNMGQLLFTGIVPPERAGKVASALMGEKLFTGFGIRTVAQGEARYNPLSYHNGSVWPHDTALIAAGLGRTGHTPAAAKVFEGLLAAAQHNDWRLPELFGGSQRKEGTGPTPYPQACSPQAWAAAAPFQLLQAVLGLEIDGQKHEVKIDPTNWRAEWGTLRMSGLAVGDRRADLEISGGAVKLLRGEGVKLVSPRKIAPRQIAPPRA